MQHVFYQSVPATERERERERDCRFDSLHYITFILPSSSIMFHRQINIKRYVLNEGARSNIFVANVFAHRDLHNFHDQQFTNSYSTVSLRTEVQYCKSRGINKGLGVPRRILIADIRCMNA
jgi:hypothetical protein